MPENFPEEMSQDGIRHPDVGIIFLEALWDETFPPSRILSF